MVAVGPQNMEALVTDAEEALLLGDFCTAEKAAESALKRSLYSKQSSSGLQDRAAVVLLQSIQEKGRFGSCRKLLCDFFGSLESAPPTSLLLWLSLALDDCGSKREAPQLILQLLQSKRPEAPGGWTRRHYLCLLHLYLFDVLLPELREVSEVQKWLESTELPIHLEERQALMEELLALAPTETLSLPSSTAAGISALQPGKAGPSLQALGVRTALAAAPQRQEQQQQQQLGRHASGLRKLPGCQSVVGEIEEDQGKVTAAAGPHGPQAGGSGAGTGGGLSGWVGATCQQVKEAVQAAYSCATGSRVSHGAGGSSSLGPPLPTAQVVAGAVLGAVLLYAFYAEREAIRRRLGRAQRSAWQGLSELLRMGLSLSPNPMTAPR